MIDVKLHPESQIDAWDGYVRRHPEASSYHLWRWRDLLGPGLGHHSYYLSAWQDGRIRGVLPLVCMSRPLMSRTLVSLPFVNYGGILADDGDTEKALLDAGISLAETLRAASLELRHRRQDLAQLPARAHRVTMVLELPDSPEMLWKSLGSKLRSQIRRADKAGLTVHRGGLEELPAFYEVFAQNMRDLGSPVWSKGFFRRVLEAFPDRSRLYRVDLDGKPLAAGFVFRFQQTVEIPWASSLRAYNSLGANLKLYWQILADASREGYARFDFGRSAPGSGTYKFKEQWGARERPLYWHYWPKTLPAGGGIDGQRERLENAWRRLPVWTTRLIGPPIRRLLPH